MLKRQIIAALMLSRLYFSIPLWQRCKMVDRLCGDHRRGA
jgi:hypothetical protein